MSDDKNEQFNPASFERAAVVLCLSCGISWEPDERAFTAHFTGQRMPCWKCKGDTGSLWDAILNMLVEWFVFGHSLVFAGARELHIRETLRHEEVKEIDLTKHGVPEGAEVLHLNFTPVGRSAMATMHHGNSPELGPIGPKFIVSGRMLGESVAGNEGWLGISAIWHADRDDDTVVRHLVDAAREYHRGRFGGVIVPANIAAEAALTPVLALALRDFANKETVKRFLHEGATYSYQVKILIPLIARVVSAHPLSADIRNVLDRLRKLRNEVAHNGVVAQLSRGDAAQYLAAAIFAVRYSAYLRSVVERTATSMPICENQ